MSDEAASSSDSNSPLDLSDLNFGPAWARDTSESKSVKKFKDRGDREDRNREGGRRNENRGGRGGGRKEQRGGGNFHGQKGGRGRRGDDRRQPRHEVEPPEGVTLKLMPAEESLDLLAKRVLESGQTYSVFDLAKVLLQSRDRFRVTFESVGSKLFRCREDQSVWLSREEALRQLWRGDWFKTYYDKVDVEGEVPKGSFSAVARCGLSNQLLGPPNYHGYQEKLTALHRERFSNMPFEAYKAKVRMEHGEEAVEAWLESMKTVTKWKVAERKEESEASEDESEQKQSDAAEAVDTPAETTDVKGERVEEPAREEIVSEEVGAETTAETDATEAGPEAPTEKEEAAEGDSPENDAGSVETDTAEREEHAGDGPAELLDDARAVERHFADHHFDEVFEETDRAWVTGDIRGNLLSPGLLTLLKRGVAEEKRYPAKLMPIVCRQLSGRHVAVFKWNKKLKVGPSRPHAVPTDTPLAERPRAMIDFLLKKSGTTLKEFWEVLMPDGVTGGEKHEWLQDFQWLLGQGHIILLSDTTVHLAKTAGPPPPAEKSAEKPVEKKEASSPHGPSKEESTTNEIPEKEPTNEGSPGSGDSASTDAGNTGDSGEEE